MCAEYQNQIETKNDFFFTSNGKTLYPQFPVIIRTKEQAYRTAAWIKAMAEVLPSDGTNYTFTEIYGAVINS
jgi:hypothetical protein